MRLVVSALVIVSLSTVTSQSAPTHKHQQEKKHGLDREEDGSLKSKYPPKGSHDAEFDHEAILGSRDEAEEFDDLSPEEAKRRLKVLLGKMDINLNEHIDKSELEAWILKSMNSLNEEDNKDRFEEADSDSNGMLTWEEFKKSEYEGANEDEQLWMEQDHYLFQAADKNGDGSLSLKEFTGFINPDGDLEMQQHVLKLTLGEKDLDKNGLLSLEEFIGNRSSEHDEESEWLDSEKERFNQELDKDGNGFLNDEEIVAWIIPEGYQSSATDEADHLISEADEDKDGILSFEEILDKVDVFAGSEATDYGNHLTNMHRFEEEL